MNLSPRASAEQSVVSLAVYGELTADGADHHIVKRLATSWLAGTAKGWLYEIGWGDAEGLVGFTIDPDGQDIRVEVLLTEFDSSEADKRLRPVDQFIGDGFERSDVVVTLDDGAAITTQIHTTRTDN